MRRVPWLEAGLGALLLAGLVLPAFVGYGAWIPALALAIACAALQGLLNGRRPVVPIAIAVYLGIYALAAIHETSSLIEAGKYFAPPVLALTVAWATLGDPAARRRVVMLVVAAVAIQVPVALVQVADALITYGADSIAGADEITGLLGEGAPGTLTEVGILVGIVTISAGYLGRRAKAGRVRSRSSRSSSSAP